MADIALTLFCLPQTGRPAQVSPIPDARWGRAAAPASLAMLPDETDIATDCPSIGYDPTRARLPVCGQRARGARLSPTPDIRQVSATVQPWTTMTTLNRQVILTFR